MTKPKKKENKIFILIFTLFFFNLNFQFTHANEIKCKRFDIKCKTSKFIEETKQFQKKGLNDGKKQLNKTKNELNKTKDNLKIILPKK
tara:strand:+ start:1103 stop:1366 length:264 start_codon:yes stop_codon:yes gene_type:complete